MKKTLLFTLFAVALSFTACDDDIALPDSGNNNIPEFDITRTTFPEDDGSQALSGTPNANVKKLLAKINVAESTDTLGRANITTEQYAEIKSFTDNLVKDCESQYKVFEACYNWVIENISYDYANNDPYAVFLYRKAVCQGYANLLFIMLHSQGVPAVVCNGILNPIGGHAWNYVCCEGVWYVADPTNSSSFKIENLNSYSHLIPKSLDMVLFKENDCWFDYSNTNLNICNITSKNHSFTVPYSTNGYMVTSLNPLTQISSSIKELYIGKNIKSLGENPIGLSVYAPNLEYVNIDPANPKFASYLGTVYSKDNGDYELVYIPGAMKCVELMPMNTIYKNTVYEHNAVEVLIVAPGTKSIEAYGVEKCPNLKVAYVPYGVDIADNAFYGVHPDFQIIRGDYTNIPEIRE